MLTREDKWFLIYLTTGYLAFAELSSLAMSKFPLCILVIEYQSANSETGYQTCAPLHEGITRGVVFIWKYANHDNVAALGTLLIALFTWTLWRSTRKLWIATNETLRLTRAEFLSTHRPKMRMKHVWLTSDFDWRQGKPLEVNLDIVNVGNTEGLITWVNYESILLPPNQRLPQRPPYDETPFGPDMRITRFRTNAGLGPGITLARPVCDGRVLDAQEVQDVLWNRQRLYLIGTIEYFDAGGGLRQTGYCRRLTFSSYPPAEGELGRFDIEQDRDYEFEEWGD